MGLFYMLLKSGVSFFMLIPFISSSILILIIDIDLLFEEKFLTISDKNATLLISILIFSGISALAYNDAKSILYNKQYKYAKIPTNKDNISQSQSQSDTLKFIGKADETFVFISLKNDKIHFIKSENLVLYDK